MQTLSSATLTYVRQHHATMIDIAVALKRLTNDYVKLPKDTITAEEYLVLNKLVKQLSELSNATFDTYEYTENIINNTPRVIKFSTDEEDDYEQ